MNMNRAKVRAYDTAALNCAQQIRTGETEALSRAGGYAAYAALDGGIRGVCDRILTSAPPGYYMDQSFQYAVRHPKGSRTYLVSDLDLRWTTAMPSMTLQMSDATPLGGQEVASIPQDPASTSSFTLTLTSPMTSELAGSAPTVRLRGAAGSMTVIPTKNLATRANYEAPVVYTFRATQLPPGEYEYTLTTNNVCSTIGGVQKCPPALGSLTRRRTFTVTGSDNAVATARTDAPFGGIIYWMDNFDMSTPGAWNFTDRNIRTAYFSYVVNRLDPSILAVTNCVDQCWETEPTVWKREPYIRHVLGGFGVQSSGMNSGGTAVQHPPGLYVLDYTPIDSSQPIDLTNLPPEQRHVLRVDEVMTANFSFRKNVPSIADITIAKAAPFYEPPNGAPESFIAE